MTLRTQTFRTRMGQCASLGLLGLAACHDSPSTSPQIESLPESPAAEAALSLSKPIPPELAVPSEHALAAFRKGVGVQIYTCAAADAAYSWAFKAPQADLLSADKRAAGSHYAGPTWKALDGSSVVGTKIASASIRPSAVPALLLQAASHSGSGVFSNVSYIHRLNTTGGLAPTKACGAANAGEVVEVAYTADYFFYNPPSGSDSRHE